MNLNSILIGSEDPQRLADYYTKLFGEPGWNEVAKERVRPPRRRRSDGSPGAVRSQRGRRRHVDLHVRRPRRQLLPAHEPDGLSADLLDEIGSSSREVRAQATQLRRLLARKNIVEYESRRSARVT